MKITVFTGNQPRHLNLVNKLSKIASVVYSIQECVTVFPGQVGDLYKKTKVMQDYFKNVISAEKLLFGNICFLGNNIKTLSIKSGDVSKLDKSQLEDSLNSDIYVVFGASYIKGWLADFLLSKGAFNIHMGLSPYYRGSSCNFWALYDMNPSYVGATIHRLSLGIDDGAILFHCLPKYLKNETSFDFTMKSVKTSHDAICSRIKDKSIFNMTEQKQNKKLEIRYSRNKDFDDIVATEFLKKQAQINFSKLKYPLLKDPYFG